MLDMLGSAVVQETVSEIAANLKEKYKVKSSAKENKERLEMAHIRLEAALQTSDGWNITGAPPLLRWRSKLKRAVQECDETLRRCRQRVEEEEAMEDVLRGSSFPKRAAHKARSFVSSIFSRGSSSSELGRSTVRRFEWFADGAGEFLRFMECGDTPRQYMFVETLFRHLFAGKTVEYKVISGNQHYLFLLRPVSTPKGLEGRLMYVLRDGDAPENSFLFSLFLRLSESTDVVGIAVRCLELLTPHFKSTANTVMTRLTQIPMHDLRWVPYADSSHNRKQHWEYAHTIFSNWLRPNPHCCQQQQQHGHQNYKQPFAAGSRNTGSSSLSSDVYLEPVFIVYLQGHVPLSAGFNGKKGSPSPYMKLRLLFSPHASSGGVLPPSVAGSAMEIVHGQDQQQVLCANISFEKLDEIMLPKAIDCRDAGAKEYHMLWRSKHGAAYIQVCTLGRTFRKNRRGGHHQQQQDKKVEGWTSWTQSIPDFFSSWAAHAPAHLQGSIADWMNEH